MPLHVRFRPLRPDEYAGWRTRHVAASATRLGEQLGLAGDEAERVATDELAAALPDGVGTADMHLVVAEEHRGPILGWLWLGPHPRAAQRAYVYDIVIAPEARRRGLGRRLMEEAERLADEAGYGSIGLAVAAGNRPARSLYDDLGYAPVSVAMAKPLPTGP